MALFPRLRWFCKNAQVQRPGQNTKNLGVNITPLPSQPAMIAYSDTPNFTASNWAHPGALVVAGRASYADQRFKDISAGGGTVILYIDAIIANNYGRYHSLLAASNSYGAAVPQWTGPIQVNTNPVTYLNDFRTTSTMHQTTTDAAGAAKGWTKLEAILELAVAENPHIAGFFADDLGSRSWFPVDFWTSWGSTNQQLYRDSAIMVAQTFRRVCDRHGLVLMVNGTWESGSLASNGGGYPNMAIHGCSIADGGVWEHHDYESSYGPAYMSGAQWATAGLSPGKAINMIICTDNSTATGAQLRQWNDANVAAYTNGQSSAIGYTGDNFTPWGSFRQNGLPSQAK